MTAKSTGVRRAPHPPKKKIKKKIPSYNIRVRHFVKDLLVSCALLLKHLFDEPFPSIRNIRYNLSKQISLGYKNRLFFFSIK